MPNRTSKAVMGLDYFLSYHLLRSKCVLEITAATRIFPTRILGRILLSIFYRA